MAKKESKKKKKLSIASRKCVGCSYCKLNCPADAILVVDAIAHPTDMCTKCGVCVWVCPVAAIALS